MSQAEKYQKIREQVSALRALIRCRNYCLARNRSSHDDNCAVSIADEYVKTIYELIGSSDQQGKSVASDDNF